MQPATAPAALRSATVKSPGLARLHCRWVRHFDDFDALRTAWNQLVERAHPGNVFLRHEWLCAAWAWRATDAQLQVVTLWDDEVLHAALPLIVWHDKDRRNIGFLTVPDTQRCGILAEAEDLGDLAAAVVHLLRHDMPDWDCCELGYLPAADSQARHFADLLASHGYRMHSQAHGANAGISLTGDWPTYYGRRSRRLKKGNNLIANVLSRDNRQVVVHHVTTLPDATARTALLDQLIEVSTHSWKSSTGTTLDQPGPQAFIRSLTEAAADQGWLSVWILELDGRCAAMEYQISFRGQIHALRADFRADLSALSPGTYLNWKLLEQSFTGEAAAYWMGPGDNAYKQRWADIEEPLVCYRLYNTNLRGRWLSLRERCLKPLYHRVRDRWTRHGART